MVYLFYSEIVQNPIFPLDMIDPIFVLNTIESHTHCNIYGTSDTCRALGGYRCSTWDVKMLAEMMGLITVQAKVALLLCTLAIPGSTANSSQPSFSFLNFEL